jgi:hypothetical protein
MLHFLLDSFLQGQQLLKYLPYESKQPSKRTLSDWVLKAVNASPTQGIRALKAARFVNPRWTNLIVDYINGDTGKRPCKVKGINKNIIKYYSDIYLRTSCAVH